MRFVLLLTVLLSVFVFLDAAQFIAPHDPGKDSKGYCYFEQVGAMKKGQVLPYGKCGTLECTNSRDVIGTTCGVISTPCGTTEDLSKPYPECCPKAKPC